MRLTKNKIAILETLAAVDDWSCIEYGPPPRNAATVAAMMGKEDHRPIARTLRLMEQQGVVVAETRPVPVWCDIGRGGHYNKQLKCYWPAHDLEQAKAAAREWADGAEERAQNAWQAMERLHGWR